MKSYFFFRSLIGLYWSWGRLFCPSESNICQSNWHWNAWLQNY